MKKSDIFRNINIHNEIRDSTMKMLTTECCRNKMYFIFTRDIFLFAKGTFKEVSVESHSVRLVVYFQVSTMFMYSLKILQNRFHMGRLYFIRRILFSKSPEFLVCEVLINPPPTRQNLPITHKKKKNFEDFLNTSKDINKLNKLWTV